MKRVLSRVIVTLASFTLAYGQPPQTISNQGLLTDSSGAPLAGSFDLTFRLYPTSSGGTALWTETHTNASVQQGTFNVRLGSITPFTGITFDQQLYLSLAVDGGPEMSPRSPLTSVPSAFFAQNSELLDSLDATAFAPAAHTHNQYLPLAGGSMTGAITNSGDPAITMGKGNFGMGNLNTGVQAFVAGRNNRARGMYSTVAGGGGETAADSNSALGNWSAVGGGIKNIASGPNIPTIGGGGFNTASGSYATVSGGISNTASADNATVGGGSGNVASSSSATVAGGWSNVATGTSAPTVGGGESNVASGSHAAVGGGRYNSARGGYAVVAGGGGFLAADSNCARGDFSTVSGGTGNIASGHWSTIGGGQRNAASTDHATVCGGLQNSSSSGFCATVGGGAYDTATGFYSTVPGGFQNKATGGYSFAAGKRAKATHRGAFVWADSTEADFVSTASNQFLIRASGGVGIGTASPAALLHVNGSAGNNTGIWSDLSDRRLKREIEPIHGALETVRQLQGVSFRWKDTGKDKQYGRVRGLIAQDVEEVIPEWIKTDPDGYKRLEPIGIDALLIEAIKELKAENDDLRRRIAVLEKGEPQATRAD